MGLDHEQRLQKLVLLNLAKRKIKDNLTATHMKGGYDGDRVNIFSVSAAGTPRENEHRLQFGKFRFNIKEKLFL